MDPNQKHDTSSQNQVHLEKKPKKILHVVRRSHSFAQNGMIFAILVIAIVLWITNYLNTAMWIISVGGILWFIWKIYSFFTGR